MANKWTLHDVHMLRVALSIPGGNMAQQLAADLNELEAYRANIKTIEYKGYVAELEIDLDDGIIVGRVINTETVIAFHDYGVTGIRGALIDCIEDYLECCFRQGIQPETPRIKS